MPQVERGPWPGASLNQRIRGSRNGHLWLLSKHIWRELESHPAPARFTFIAAGMGVSAASKMAPAIFFSFPPPPPCGRGEPRSEEHTAGLQSLPHTLFRLLPGKK